MWLRNLSAVGILVLTAQSSLADGAADDGAKTATALPKKVHVEVLSALVGPCKADGSNWDGFSKCDAKAQDKVNKALATKAIAVALDATPYGAAAAVMSTLGGGFLSKEDKPDPYGFVEVAIGDEYQKNLAFPLLSADKPAKDNYAPQFPAHDVVVPLEQGTRLRVTLKDKDINKSDDIGRAELNYNDLIAALKSEKIYQVQVADQTQNQLLFLGIEVRAVEEKH